MRLANHIALKQGLARTTFLWTISFLSLTSICYGWGGLTMTSTFAGQVLLVGDTITITWTLAPGKTLQSYLISISPDAGLTACPIGSIQPGDPQFTTHQWKWQVQDSALDEQGNFLSLISDTCLFRVKDYNWPIGDVSSLFKITSPNRIISRGPHVRQLGRENFPYQAHGGSLPITTPSGVLLKGLFDPTGRMMNIGHGVSSSGERFVVVQDGKNSTTAIPAMVIGGR